MRLFFRYLCSHIKSLGAFFLFAVIFTVTFLLYRLPLSAVIYPICLCGGLGLIIIVTDFLIIRKKYEILNSITEIVEDDIEKLPKTGALCEDAYRKLLSELCIENRRQRWESDRKFSDAVDYYTVWAHQIKTPIASMKLTLQGEDSAFSRKLLNELARIEQYVEMVLAYLRLDSDTGDYVLRLCSLDGLIRQSVKKFASEFILRRLSLDYEPVSLNVVTDEKWLCFVLEQLLSNALKYTKEGRISVYLECGSTLCIEDTGIGISESDLPRVFEKGYTGYNGRMDRSASGIGLYLCRCICQRLGIGISVSSVLGRGTTVRLDMSQHRLKAE